MAKRQFKLNNNLVAHGFVGQCKKEKLNLYKGGQWIQDIILCVYRMKYCLFITKQSM